MGKPAKGDGLILYRRANRDDMVDLRIIHHANFGTRARDIGAYLKSSSPFDGGIHTATLHNKPIGYIAWGKMPARARPCGSAETAISAAARVMTVEYWAVARHWRRRGIGMSLLRDMADFAKTMPEVTAIRAVVDEAQIEAQCAFVRAGYGCVEVSRLKDRHDLYVFEFDPTEGGEVLRSILKSDGRRVTPGALSPRSV